MAAKQRDVVPPQAKKACEGAYMDSSTHFYHHHWTQVSDQLHVLAALTPAKTPPA